MKIFLSTISKIALTSILLLGFLTNATAQKKNVLFLMADDMNYWTSMNGYYPMAQTPNIDKLGKMGVFFREAHCSSPVCNPSRNALWSGLRPSTTGIDANSDGFVREKSGLEDIVTMNQYFMQNGYWVYGAGKLYHPKMSASNHETDPENWSFINENGQGCQGGSVYKYCNHVKTNYCYSANPNEMTRGNCNDYNLAHDVKEVIEDYPTSPQKNKPFFIACGVFRPHAPWNSPLSFWNKFDYESLVEPPAYNSELDDPGDDVHQDFVNNDQWMRAIQGYLASCALADHNVGIMVDALLDSEYKDNTIIVFCGDHGWNLGEKGRWGKFDHCDEANHTTLVIYDPSASGNGQECLKPVSLQDLYPTLIELCNLPERKNVEGNSLKPLLEAPGNPDVNSFALMMYGDKHYIKTEKWRFIDDGAGSVLNNNETDPYQWENLYGQSQYDNVVSSLRHKIDSIIAIGSNIRDNYYEFMPPVVPTNLLGHPLSSSSIKLTWQDNSNNEIGFNIFRRTNGTGEFAKISKVKANTDIYVDEDVSDENTYDYFVQVYNDADTLSTNPVTGIKPEDVKPANPTNLIASPIDVDQIDLSWIDNAFNETGYIVYRKDGSNGDFNEIATLDADKTSYSDNSVNEQTLYSYYIVAVNDEGESASNTAEDIKPQKITYPGVAYEGNAWVMPGASVEAWKYDKVGSGSDWKADSSVTIGLYDNTADGKGQDVRSYGDACLYPAARWNGGGNTMRNNGQWLRYTCNFSSGEYNLKIRGRNSSKQIELTIRNIAGLTEVYQTTMNFPDDFENIGSGGDGSGVTYWFENNNNISVSAGTYIVEFVIDDVSTGGVFGEFTFEKSNSASSDKTKINPGNKHRYLLNNQIHDNYLNLDLTPLNPAVWLKIINLKGEVVQKLFVGGEEKISVEINPNLAKGLYILYIDDSETRASERFMLQ